MEFRSCRSVSFEARWWKSHYEKCDLDGDADGILLRGMTKGDEKSTIIYEINNDIKDDVNNYRLKRFLEKATKKCYAMKGFSIIIKLSIFPSDANLFHFPQVSGRIYSALIPFLLPPPWNANHDALSLTQC